jgi:Na+/H+ antiporter NhaC
LGLTPSALCILSPLSIIGIYLTGIVALSTENRGLFIESLRYNFGAFFVIIFVVLLTIGKLPLLGGMKKAQMRVNQGGPIWPEGTENDEGEDEKTRGRLVNLFLPVFVFITSSIIIGNVLYGMLITLIFVFMFYCFQQYMSPDEFFKHFIYGIENLIAPVVIFIVGKCFAFGLYDLGFTAWLSDLMHSLIGGQVWLLAPIIFVVGVLIGALFNDHWAMYAICIPIAATLAATFDGNIALYIGAVCAAGLLGNELAPGNIYFIGSMLGVEPLSYYRAKLPYIIVIIVLTLCAYIAVGLL